MDNPKDQERSGHVPFFSPLWHLSYLSFCLLLPTACLFLICNSDFPVRFSHRTERYLPSKELACNKVNRRLTSTLVLCVFLMTDNYQTASTKHWNHQHIMIYRGFIMALSLIFHPLFYPLIFPLTIRGKI